MYELLQIVTPMQFHGLSRPGSARPAATGRPATPEGSLSPRSRTPQVSQATPTTTARPNTGEPRRVVASLTDRCAPARGRTTAQPAAILVTRRHRGTHQQRRRGRPGGGVETGWAAAEMHSEQMNPGCKRRISGYPRRYVAPDPGGAVGRQRWRVTLRGTYGREHPCSRMSWRIRTNAMSCCMIAIPRPRRVGWSQRVRRLAVVDDVDADSVGFGPEGQLDEVVGGRRAIGVLDAVARRLAHGQHQVVFGLPGQAERRQPSAHLGAQRCQLSGSRRPVRWTNSTVERRSMTAGSASAVAG